MSKTRIGYVTIGCVVVYYQNGKLSTNHYCARYKLDKKTKFFIGEHDKKSYSLTDVFLFFLSHITKNISKPFCIFDFKPLSFFNPTNLQCGQYI